MKKLYASILLACTLATPSVLRAQETKPCITQEIANDIFATDPEAKKRYDDLDQLTKEIMNNHPQHKGADIADSPFYVIPVVVHIIHTYGPEFIDDNQVYEAIKILNRDYNVMNADTAEILPYFQPRIGRTKVIFRLAQLDPQGNCTNGITRTYSNYTENGRQSTQITNLINWDTRKYVNIYIVRAIDGAGAFSNFPGAYPVGSKLHGVIAAYNQFGKGGSSQGNFAERTIPHEIGHFFNLPHTWGMTNNPGLPENCSDDDGVKDTPNTIGVSNQGCNKSMASCAGDPDPYANVENYMDYSNCARMFTKGQSERMRIAIHNADTRKTLWTPANLIATGTNDGYVRVRCMPKADFSCPPTACANALVEFADRSWGDTVTTWKWDFNGGVADDNTIRNPTVTFPSAGQYRVKLVVSNSAGKDSIAKDSVITIYPAKGTFRKLSEGMENPEFLKNGWRIETEDNRKWERSTAAAYTGSASMYIKNFSGNPADAQDAFITPSMDFSDADTITLTFKCAYARRNSSSDDALNIYVSKDCGKTYNKIFGKKGTSLASSPDQTSNFVPTSQSQWKEWVVDLKSVKKTADVLIKFENVSGVGNNVYIDDINITSNGKATGFNQIINVGGISVYPNPFENSTKVSFNLNTDEKVKLAVYDVVGKEVGVIVNEKLTAGDHTFEISEHNANLNGSGFYFVKLFAGNEVSTQRIVLVK